MDRASTKGHCSDKDEVPTSEPHDSLGGEPRESGSPTGRRRFIRIALRLLVFVAVAVLVGRIVTVMILGRITDKYGTILWDLARRPGHYAVLSENVPAADTEPEFRRMIRAIKENDKITLQMSLMGNCITILKSGTRIYVLRQFEAAFTAHIQVVETGEKWWVRLGDIGKR